ncbi:unnamed protein product [Prorocentrum cordatum]|uniref:TFIIS central domain-containing protein n=1 Tax=Prorocentrum cordatum TaxID=2364126 RepID=A0ABN9V905_9DINO|nr:unnamed protein product [Polarella glacialis]
MLWQHADECEACSAVNRQRIQLGRLRSGVRSGKDASRVISVVKGAIAAISGVPPRSARLLQFVDGAVSALEALDRRMSPRVRAVLGEGLGAAVASRQAHELARRALGPHLGDRLAAVLRRWHEARLHEGPAGGAPSGSAGERRPTRPRGAGAGPARAAPARAARGGRGQAAEELRDGAVEKLCRAMSARGSGAGEASSAAVLPPGVQELGCEIERELFALCGSQVKDYKLRARSLAFNLAAPDGVLLGRVLGRLVAPAQLARLQGEDLASDAVQAARREQREKYFRSEVHLTEPLPKKRRHIGRPRPPEAPSVAAPPAPDGLGPLAGSGQEDELPAALSGALGAPLDDAELVPLPDAERVPSPPAPLQDAEDTSEDAAIARLLALLPPSPEESSSSSSSSSPSPSPRPSRSAGPAARPPLPVKEGAPRGAGPGCAAAPARRLAPGSPGRPPARAPAEDVCSDASIAALLQGLPPSPSSPSSTSSSASSGPGQGPGEAASSSQAASSSSQQAGGPGAPDALERVVCHFCCPAMGFPRSAAQAALRSARGSVEGAVEELLRRGCA